MLGPQRNFQRKLLTFLSPQHDTLSAEDQMTLLVIFALPECQVCGRQLVLQVRPEHGHVIRAACKSCTRLATICTARS